MAKFKPYSRRALRDLRADWLRRNALVVSVVAVGLVVVLGISTWSIATLLNGAPRWYVLGVVHAGLVAAGLHLLHTAFLAHDRDALSQIRGAWGEENTRSELQRARRRRLIWGWVDSITLQAGDLDHVIVTRRAGLVIADSKWRNQVTTSDTIQMARAARKAQTRAEGLARTLLRNERGARHRAKLQSLTVTPVVVVWGTAQRTVPENAVINGVPFIAGRKLISWLRQLDGDSVSKDAARDALQRLESYREQAWIQA